MQTLDEVKEENLNKKKSKQKIRIRGLIIGLDALLLCYACFLTISNIVTAVNKSSKNNQGDIITILNKNEKESLDIYNKYVSSKDDVLDVGTYGRYLLTSNYRLSYSLDNDTNDFYLLNLTNLENDYTKMEKVTVGTKLDQQIDLYSLDVGDYMIASSFHSPEGYTALHYAQEDYFEQVMYSFPTEDGLRTKITIKGKASSPALIINVSKQEASLPDNYYDVVILKEENVKIDWFKNTKLKIKEVSTLQEAYKVHASYAINVIDGNELYTSNYVSVESSKSGLIPTGVLQNLDSNNAIRELGGYVFNAGYGISGDDDIAKASQEIKKINNSSRAGKYTLTIGKDYENPSDKIKEIFNY